MLCFAVKKEGIKVEKEADQVLKVDIDWIAIKEMIQTRFPLDRVNVPKLKNFLIEIQIVSIILSRVCTHHKHKMELANIKQYNRRGNLFTKILVRY